MDHDLRVPPDAGNGLPLIARIMRVPLAADSVARPRLVYGGLDLTSSTGVTHWFR